MNYVSIRDSQTDETHEDRQTVNSPVSWFRLKIYSYLFLYHLKREKYSIRKSPHTHQHKAANTTHSDVRYTFKMCAKNFRIFCVSLVSALQMFFFRSFIWCRVRVCGCTVFIFRLNCECVAASLCVWGRGICAFLRKMFPSLSCLEQIRPISITSTLQQWLTESNMLFHIYFDLLRTWREH